MGKVLIACEESQAVTKEWRTTDAAAAVYAELLDAALGEANEEAWGAIRQNWLMEKAGESPAATE